jgi:hypothetical protein
MTTITYSPEQAGGLKKAKIMYWVFTSIIVLFEGVGSLFFNSQMAIDGIRHMGFPDYFRVELGIAKIIGAIILIVPAIPARLKEWAYVGYGICFLSAFIGTWAVDGPLNALFPLVFFGILCVSYIYFHKINRRS